MQIWRKYLEAPGDGIGGQRVVVENYSSSMKKITTLGLEDV